MSNGLDPDQACHFVGPDPGPNCLQSLSADDTSGQRVLNEVTEQIDHIFPDQTTCFFRSSLIWVYID